jgi:IMP dehydrogenase/GMP reductase
MSEQAPIIGRVDLREVQRTEPQPAERFAEQIPIGLTFDDVLLRPAKSEVHPNFVEVATRLPWTR